jgi:hypothetical protein
MRTTTAIIPSAINMALTQVGTVYRPAVNLPQCGEFASLIESAFDAKIVRGTAKKLCIRFALTNKRPPEGGRYHRCSKMRPFRISKSNTKNVRKTGGPIGIAWSAIRQIYLCKRGGMSISSFRG